MGFYLEGKPGGGYTYHSTIHYPIYTEVCKQMAAHRKLDQPNILPMDYVTCVNRALGKNDYDPSLTPEKENLIHVMTQTSDFELAKLNKKLGVQSGPGIDRAKVIDEFFASCFRLSRGIVAEWKVRE